LFDQRRRSSVATIEPDDAFLAKPGCFDEGIADVDASIAENLTCRIMNRRVRIWTFGILMTLGSVIRPQSSRLVECIRGGDAAAT